jgi:hypothetical protein
MEDDTPLQVSSSYKYRSTPTSSSTLLSSLHLTEYGNPKPSALTQ